MRNDLQKREKQIISARAGEFWSINDAKTRGHKSIITKAKGNEIRHIPITHKSKTRNMNNIKLQKNPDPNKRETSYILPKVQKSNKKDLGKKHPNLKIKNATDKSVVRHIKKKDTNKKR